MQPELRYELFYTRDQLERLQPLSRTLFDMIVHSHALLLRPISIVWMDTDGSNDKIQVSEDDDTGFLESDYEASVRDGDFAETALLLYWQAQETDFTVVNIDVELPERTYFDFVPNAIVRHLRPRAMQFAVTDTAWYGNGDGSEYLELLVRDSFLTSLKTCCLYVQSGAFPPPAFFFNEHGYANYELKCFKDTEVDAIDRFIESFVQGRCANNKLVSVCIGWKVWGAPSRMPKQLSKPTKIDMPDIDFVASLIPFVERVSQCEMHSFVNAKQWMRMDAYKWTV
ncbi:hypothetical protein AAVH_21068 [Aphelenchoides avenae]|nr:hypothetical protein AAVH_21068 [Aphelenchus avenae]